MLDDLVIYKESGIWGWMKLKSEALFAKRWQIWLVDKNLLIPVYPKGKSGSELSPVSFDVKNYNKKISITKVPDGSIVKIPATISEEFIFYWQLEFLQSPNEKMLENIKDILILLLAYESLNKKIYPSFVPFIYPLQSENQANEIIKESRQTIFINGQAGVGKKSFVQAFLLYNYFYFIDYAHLESVENIFISERLGENKLVIIKEVALLNHEKQLEIINEYKEGTQAIFLFLSVYSLDQLEKHSIVLKKFSKLLEEHKLIIPSLQNRKNYVKDSIEFWLKAKACYFLSFIHTVREKNFSLEIEENFTGIYKKLLNAEKMNIIQEDVSFLKDKKLREVIVDLEIKAINYAHQKVGDSQHKVAKFLGVSRGSLQHKLRKYKIYGIKWE